MSYADTSAIVATVGTISALLVIALFLRGIGRGKAHESQDVKISRWPRLDGNGVSEGRSVPRRVMYGEANDPRWSKEAMEIQSASMEIQSAFAQIREVCAQRIADDETASQKEGDEDARK